jgi:hypothetical protein
VDDGREQTRAIHEKQRAAQTIEGILARQERGAVMALHQNAQRLLKPVTVANPFAHALRFADHATRTRRDHAKYLTLINTITLLHQHQRPMKEVEHRGGKVRYIEVTREDIAVADKLAAQVLARSMDELAPQTRRLLGVIDELVTAKAKREGVDREDVRFTQRELRGLCAFGSTQLKVHLRTLMELEYVAQHRVRHAQRHVYELLHSATEGERGPFDYDENRAARSSGRSGTGRLSNRPVLSREVVRLSEAVGDSAGHVLGARAAGTSYADTTPDAAE